MDVEERSKHGIVLIEQITHESEYLDVFCDLVGRMQVHDPVGGQLWVLV